MKKFLFTILLFCVVFFVVEKGLILLRNYSPKTEVDKRLEMILIGKMNSDVLVYGSSRGARDILATQLGDSLHRSVYNLSFPGSGISFHEFLLKETLLNKNKKPSLIILTVDDPTELLENTNLNFRLDRLYPLVKYPAIRDVLVEQGHKNYLLSKLFIVHQLNISNFDISQKKFKAIDTLRADGSMPISFTDSRFAGKYLQDITYYDVKKELEQQRKSFLNFIDLCKQNNITLLIVCTPNFYKPTIGFFDRMKTLIGDKANFMLYDTTQNNYTKQAGYFSDEVHLKTNGAILYTNELADYIKKNNLLK
jgi:hypothetical protein